MDKRLSEMTLKELWVLFPIRLTEYNGEWLEQYEEMAVLLKENLSACNVVRIRHIGSTAISGI